MGHQAPHGRTGDDAPDLLLCSFCGREEAQVATLIAGPTAYICDTCVRDCLDILVRDEEPAVSLAELPCPHVIHEDLDAYVVGQETAKRTLAVAVYNHYKRLSYRAWPGDPEIRKSNVLLVGPSGSGKTLLVETLARTLAVPFTVADATTLTESGYVGEDVESIAQRLLEAADGDPARAARGIVYLDEVDKLGSRAGSQGHARDIAGEGVQESLLRLIEGRTVTVKAGGNGETVDVDTREVLFIVGGAFTGLDDIVANRLNRRGMGFAANVASAPLSTPDFADALAPEDLMQYGLIPEFVGRLPVTAVLAPLDRSDLVRVLTEPRNALVRQYRELFRLEGCQLEFARDALTAMADEALARGTGARGLRAVIERVLLDAMFELPDRPRKRWRVRKSAVTPAAAETAPA